MIPDVASIKTVLTPVFLDKGVRKAVLFGSFAKGCETEESDIDLLVDCDLHGLSFFSFVDELEDLLGREVDCFDVSHIITDSPVDREIKKTGIMIYKEKS